MLGGRSAATRSVCVPTASMGSGGCILGPKGRAGKPGKLCLARSAGQLPKTELPF